MTNECACAHTKIREVTWNNHDGTQSGSMRCVDCWTEFVPVVGELGEWLRQKRIKELMALPARKPFPETVVSDPGISANMLRRRGGHSFPTDPS